MGQMKFKYFWALVLQGNHFFFGSVKQNIIKQKEANTRENLEACPKVYKKYTKGDHKTCTKRGLRQKLTSPASKLQRILTRERSTCEIRLVKELREHRKEDYSLSKEKASFSKTVMFLSFQIDQRRHKGTILQRIFSFFPKRGSSSQ